jgi:hypothetical protein
MTPLDWMFVGYSAMFAAMILYVANLGRRQAAAERELLALRTAVDAEAMGAPLSAAPEEAPPQAGPPAGDPAARLSHEPPARR